MPKYQPGLTVEYNGNSNTFGLFPPIVCTSTGEPIITIIEQSATQVVIQVAFPGETNPFVITLDLTPVVS